MSYVGLMEESQVSPEVQALYRQVREEFGFLPNYFRALGREPSTAVEQMALQGKINSGRALPQALREQIGLVVSGLNSSSYCVAVHMELLRRMGIEKAIGRKLATDYENAPVGEKERVLFRLAAKLTRKPYDFSRADVEAAREAGWDENAVYETVLTVAYFNYINAVSIGLGLVADF